MALRYFCPKVGSGSTAITPWGDTANMVLYAPSVTQNRPSRIPCTRYPFPGSWAGASAITVGRSVPAEVDGTPATPTSASHSRRDSLDDGKPGDGPSFG